MAERILPSPELLRQLLRYEPETGKLYWKERPRAMFDSDRIWRSWNAKWVGKEAFTSVDSWGYRHGHVLNVMQKAHRVIWAIHYGSDPQKEIDHINQIKTDNRIENLREADRIENMRNVSRRSNNRSGYKGVGFRKDCEKWQARITTDSKREHLGYFDSPEAAHAAYVAAAQQHHREFAKP